MMNAFLISFFLFQCWSLMLSHDEIERKGQVEIVKIPRKYDITQLQNYQL
jgi:hypothetical protein